ncbi:MFS general substrate transporter [Decorospora gaudefroyi]|uniref:MFS general substrate transporter n=1 Tax=Decorospora gaudefroyi TaxID=184978 RepID=A0A6A5K2K5_9PLEO|nr:MFS general substrate transporter [Decorospora gaudefroyi]
MVTPALPFIGDEFDIADGFMRQLVMTIFLLGFAQGPFVLAPLSEIFGRVVVLQYANLVYLIFNTCCGFAQTKEQMLVFRFLSGLGGAAPQAICNDVLADTWRKEERGKGQAIYGMLTWIAPCVGPICGAYISTGENWRWVFFSTSLFTVLVQIAALIFLSETFAPAILANKAKVVRKALKHVNKDVAVKTEYETGDRMSRILRKRLTLPFIMITASLNYLSLCLGFIIGLQISHPLMDGVIYFSSLTITYPPVPILPAQILTNEIHNKKLYARLKTTYNLQDGSPEFRVPPMLIAGLLCPIGLLIYGWSAHHYLHYLVPNLGATLLSTGLILAFQCSQAYTTDAYAAQYAASAHSVGAFLRTMCGFGFPLLEPRLYRVAGLGWGNGILAFVTLGLGVGVPGALWCWGGRLRGWSTRGLGTGGVE